MPAPVFHRIPNPTRLLWWALALLLLGGAAYAFSAAGRFLAREDALEQADAIFVLAGTRVERPLEAADLYVAGYAPVVVLTRALSEPEAVAAAERRGVHFADELDASRQLLLHLGVPAGAIVTPPRIHDNTAEESATLRRLVLEHGWRRVIVVSSKYHLRRVALATRRALSGTGVQLIVRASRYDPSTPDHWWRRRADIRWLVSEIPKLAAYTAGLGG